MPRNRGGRNGGQRGGGQNNGGDRGGQPAGGASGFVNRGNAGIKTMIRTQTENLRNGAYTTNLNMFKEATNAEQVHNYLKGTVNLLGDLRALTTHKVDNTAIVKAVANESANHDIHLIDLKLNVQGPIEDEVYALNPVLIKNIRRGNTILRLDNAETESEYVLGRKGLEKFFDLRYEFISPEQRFQDSTMSVDHHMQKNYILAGPMKALMEGQRIEVLKTLKANGENVQVSYNGRVNAWIVCSKNVGLLAQTRQEIDCANYQKDRFQFAREMAHVWFDKLDSIKAERGEEGLQQLKDDLNNKTLVGEYIGSQDHQHLVKYSRVTCIFYAVVENMSMADCIPCDEAWALFDKWGLDKVAIQTLGLFSDYGTLCDSLCRVFKDVAKSEIAQEEEGNVLYFIKRPAENAPTDSVQQSTSNEVLSLCKLKTLEYRLFRKMREKLRNFFGKPPNEQTQDKEKDSIKRFIKEAKELSQEHELPRPLSYYVELFKTAFEFLDLSQANVDLLNGEYVTFSEKLLEFFTIKHKDQTFAQNSNFFFSPILDIQSNIKYGQGAIQAYELKSGLQDEERKQVDDVEDPSEESKGPQQASATVQTRTVTYKQPRNEGAAEDISEAPIVRNKSQKEVRNVIIVIPFGVPGSGKSTIWKHIKEQLDLKDAAEWTYDSVSSDTIRAGLMKPLIDSGKTKQQAFDSTQKAGPRAYGEALGRICSDVMSIGKGKNHVLFLDKNHPVNGLKRVIEDIRKNIKGNVNIKKLYMIPEMPEGKSSRLSFLPYSENFLCQIFAWGQARTNHETLDNTDLHQVMEIQLMFLKMSKGENFNDIFLRKHQIDGFLRVPMSVESFEVPQTMINTFKQFYNEFAGIGQEVNASNITAFQAQLRENQETIMQFPEKTNQVNKIMEQLLRAKDISSSRVMDPEVEEEKKGNSNRNNQNSGAQAASGDNNNSNNQVKKSGKSPTFLGINVEADPDFERKLTSVFVNGFKQSGESQQMINDFKNMIKQLQAYNPWKFPNTYHVTTLFIGGNRNKLQRREMEFHQEGKEVQVQIRALIYVPDRLVAGLCFPNCEIENEFPHMTMMVSGGWAPVMSNSVIQATCSRGGVFEQAYIAAEDGKKPAAGAGVHTANNVTIPKKGQNEVVFVLLREPITFESRLKSYY